MAIKYKELLDNDYSLIESQDALRQFLAENQDIDWLGFDTEFVGEKRFYTLLCLIQIKTKNGIYLIDSLKLSDIRPFLDMIENPNILKITHAGDNDYRVLNSLYGTVPKNIFDTQLAAGFISSIYPISFQKLLERELSVKINKGFTVTDWESRPINKRQLAYALNDVMYLHELYKRLCKKLERSGRLAWAQEEMDILTREDYYQADPHKEALNSNLITTLSPREQIFLIRLYEWRRSEAERKNLSREMIFPAKYIGVVVKNINEGKSALRQNRLLPDRVLDTHWDMFNELFQRKIGDEERKILDLVPKPIEENLKQGLTTEFLYWLVRHKCLENNLAVSLVLPKSALKDTIENQFFLEEILSKGWRKQLLGDDLLQWIRHHEDLHIEMSNSECRIRMNF